MSREEALKAAEMSAQFGVLRALTVIGICFILIVVFLWRGEYWYVLPVSLVLMLAIYWLIRMSRYSQVYEEERTRVATE